MESNLSQEPIVYPYKNCQVMLASSLIVARSSLACLWMDLAAWDRGYANDDFIQKTMQTRYETMHWLTCKVPVRAQIDRLEGPNDAVSSE